MASGAAAACPEAGRVRARTDIVAASTVRTATAASVVLE
jgi:hypothetical protein